MLTGLPIIKEMSERSNGIPIWAVILLALVVMAIASCLAIWYINKKKS